MVKLADIIYFNLVNTSLLLLYQSDAFLREIFESKAEEVTDREAPTELPFHNDWFNFRQLH